MDLPTAKKGWQKLETSTFYSGIRDLAEAEPELFVQLLRVPTLKNFSGVRCKLENAPEVWLREFLDLGGLNTLLDGLLTLSSQTYFNRGFSSTLEQLECTRCVKIVMNSPIGLEAMVENLTLTRSLVKGGIC